MYQWVTDNVVLAENEHGSNIYCIASSYELVFVDAGMLHIYTSNFRKAMESHYGLKTSTLVITHAHIDHIMAMNVFSDCEIVAAKAATPRFEAHLATEFTEERLSRMEGVFPEIRKGVEYGGFLSPTIGVDKELNFGDLLFTVKGGHSACSSSINIGKEKCIITGDLVQSERPPYFGEPDTDIGAWISTLERWTASNIEKVLPGHGPVQGKEYLDGVSGYFKDLLEILSELKSEGVPVEDVHLSDLLPTGYWPSEELKKPAHHYSVRVLYSKL